MTTTVLPSNYHVKTQQLKLVENFFKMEFKQFKSNDLNVDQKHLVNSIDEFSQYLSSINHAKSKFSVYLLNKIKQAILAQDEKDIDICILFEYSEHFEKMKKMYFIIKDEVDIEPRFLLLMAELNKKETHYNNSAPVIMTAISNFEMVVGSLILCFIILGFISAAYHFFHH